MHFLFFKLPKVEDCQSLFQSGLHLPKPDPVRPPIRLANEDVGEMTRHRLLTLLTKITVTAKSFVGAIGGTLPLVFYNHIAYNFPEVLYRFCSVTISCHILFCQLPITIIPSWVSFHMNESYRVHCYSQPTIRTGNTKQWSG